jgi:hypothetical protein
MWLKKVTMPSDTNSDSIRAIIQQNVTLQFALYGGLLFFIVQIALCLVAPGFEGYRLYSFFLLSLIGLTSGCAGWASGIVLSPIGSQAAGAQKVLAGFAVFWTGVIVGHLPQISSAVSGWQRVSMNQAARVELLFGLGVFLFAACITFNTRFARNSDIH